MPRPASAPPAEETIGWLFKDVHWHQRWEVFRGVFTPGRNPVADICEAIRLPMNLSGKRVLDIGAWNGCFSFECERRGAKEVIAFGPEDPETSGFVKLKSVLKSEVVKYRIGSVYSISPQEIGDFDVILFLGVLYHLRYPLLALDHLRTVSAGPVFIETHVIDDYLIPEDLPNARGPALSSIREKLSKTPVWQFYPEAELGGDPSNWFGPNVAAVLSSFTSAGFKAELLSRWGTRASFLAMPEGAEPFYMKLRCYESKYPIIRRSVGL